MNTKTMPKFFTSGALIAALASFSVNSHSVQAQTSWDGSSNTSWGTIANWSVAVPTSTTEAQFYDVGAGNLTISIANTNRAAAGLVFNANADSPVTISTTGTARITLGSTGNASYVNVDVGAAAAHAISTEVAFSGNGTTWTIDNAAGFTASGIVDIGSNTRSFTKAGVGPLTLGGASGAVDLRGGVIVSGGLLTLAGAPTANNYFMPTSGSSNVSVAALSTLDMLGGNGEIDSDLTGPGEFTNSGGTTRTLTLSKGSSGVSVDTLLSGNLAIAKTAGAVIPFTNANTYSGGTTITGGRLLASNSLGSSAVGTGGVVINNGTTGALGGSGQIGTSVNPVPITIGASGGLIEPGTSSIANRLTVFGSIDLTSVGTTDMKFKLDGLTAGSDGYDQLEQTGALNLSAGVASLELDMFIGSDPIVGSIFAIINRPGSQTGVTGNFAGLTDGTVINVTNFATSNIVPLTIFYNYDSGDGFLNDVALVHVPEPASMALLGVGSVALYAWSRKRRRSK